jgi:hypothetical protein
MAIAERALTSPGKKFTIVSDGAQDQYEIVERTDTPEGIAELNQKYPSNSGWMIVGSAETMEEATHIIEKHRAEARMDFE